MTKKIVDPKENIVDTTDTAETVDTAEGNVTEDNILESNVLETVVGETLNLEPQLESETITYYPCLCPCGCGAESIVSTKLSAVLSRHARCLKCGESEHIKFNPIVNKDATTTFSPTITLLHEATEKEVEEARKANDEIRKEIYETQWARWESSLPEKFRGAHSDHSMVTKRLARLKEKKNGVASLAIFGTTGVGKTYLSISYANAAIKAGYFKPSEVLFGSESELLSAAANAPFADVETAFRRLTSGRFKMIIIDDVGRGAYLRDDMRPKIWSLILDKFYSENRVIVITSNLDNTRLSEHIGEGAMDRLRAMVGYDSIILKEPQRRKVTGETLASMVASEENPLKDDALTVEDKK